MQILIELLLLLASALIMGRIAERLKVPAVVGQIIAGMLLGPAVLHLVAINVTLSSVAEISLFFIMLLVGVGMTVDTLANHVKSAVLFSLSAFVIPMFIMFMVAYEAFGLGMGQALITSIAIGVPSISIISVLVMRYRLLRKEDGKRIIASVVLTDVIAFIVLAMIGRGVGSGIGATLSMIVFIIALFLIDAFVRKHENGVKRFFSRVSSMDNGDSVIFGMIILIGLFVATLTQLAGITYVLGAFFAGLLIHEAVLGKSIYKSLNRTLERVGEAFFIPLFFSIAGLQAALPTMGNIPLLLTLVAISGLIGGSLNYLVGKNRLKELKPLAASAFLGGRGAVGIIIANIALLEGIIGINLYSVIISGTVILSLTLPALLKSSGL